MINWLKKSGIPGATLLLILLVAGSCRKEGGTTTVEGFTFDSTNAQLVPLPGVRVSAGKFSMGGGILSGSSTTYATAYSDENGYYKMTFEAENSDVNVYSHPNRLGYGGKPYYDDVKGGRHNKLDIFFYRAFTVLKIDFERVPPLSDTLLVKQYAFGNGKILYPNEAATPIRGTVTGNRYHKIKWEVHNGTRQEFVDSVYCTQGDTTTYLIKY